MGFRMDNRSRMDKVKEVLTHLLVALLLSMLMTVSAAQTPLKAGANVPVADPYCGAGGYNETVLGIDSENNCTQITTASIPATVADWVLVELRSVKKESDVTAATTETVVARKPAFLLTSGLVVDAEKYLSVTNGNNACDGSFEGIDTSVCPPVEFSDLDTSDIKLYAVVRHLNHLDVISNEAMTTSTVVSRYIYDFTEVGAAKGGSLAAKETGNTSAMYVGDVNGDTNINAADYLEIYKTTSAPAAADIDFDGKVDETDIASPLLRNNLGRTGQLP